MILAQLKHYLQEHKRATLQDLSVHFATEPDAVRGMLEHWICKGHVRKQAPSVCRCQGCSHCEFQTLEIYEWIPS
jgi:putative ferrous iron transport protein C